MKVKGDGPRNPEGGRYLSTSVCVFEMGRDGVEGSLPKS